MSNCGSKDKKIGTITNVWDEHLCSVEYDKDYWVQNSFGHYIKGMVVVNFGFLSRIGQ